ncbi:MAG: Rne/Rng family ribonuclease [Acidisphaera sp.]|nr:Rne/Rng family ribonuclease [Acidisphaera sp.]
MTKRMLIDATHAEETRVVVLDGSRLEDYDVETSTKKQLKGNIYLAKIVRVEPSLQAAFVEYGGNRHGFLAFDEIHPDYYQIPVADRQRLLAMQAQAREEDEFGDEHDDPPPRPSSRFETAASEPTPPEAATPESAEPETGSAETGAPETGAPETGALETGAPQAEPPASALPEQSAEPEENRGSSAETDIPVLPEPEPQPDIASTMPPVVAATAELAAESAAQAAPIAQDIIVADADIAPTPPAEDTGAPETPIEGSADVGPMPAETGEETGSAAAPAGEIETVAADAPPPETVGGEDDGGEDGRERRIRQRFLRNYKIQEVIHRRQILLVQVVKEERGTKGAALTTYISLAGRFSVLMPNSPRGGGISRKITSAADRRRLKEITAELDIPEGMGLIVRTAGANRPKPEIKRDCEYLLRLWDDIRETTLRSVAPALIHEEASLIKRAIRDGYSRDIDEVLVDGEDGWKAARDYMRMLMPAHARKVQPWTDGSQPLFARYQVEAQLDAMLVPNVQLKSGGYLVINQTEALVAIDVNSGRSTRERGIEETALRTNLEAADEAARQLRLRDLAGLIVIDFIDMEAKRHNAMVERRLKEGLKNDRARIQVGHISHFGLMEMSRQRLRPSLAETSFIACPQCGGTGHVRSTESGAIHVLRGIEEEAAKRRSAEIMVHVAGPIAMYILNHKRDRLHEMEARYGMRVLFTADPALIAPQMRIERLRALEPAAAPSPALPPPAPIQPVEEIAEEEAAEEADIEETRAPDNAKDGAAADGHSVAEPAGETAEESEQRRRRRRRRRRGGRREDGTEEALPAIAEPGAEQPATEPAAEPTAEPPAEPPTEPTEAGSEEEQRARRRGRRGGRRRRREPSEEPQVGTPAEIPPEPMPVYAGPTPADPFGPTFDIFDALEAAEQAPRPLPTPPLPEPEAVTEPPEPPAPEPEPRSAEVVVLEQPAEPAIRPVLVNGTPAAERKRGWWKR